MTPVTTPDERGRDELKESLDRVISRFHIAIAFTLFSGGLLLRFLAANRSGIWWPVVGEFGTFLAAVIAIPFIYDKFLQSESKRSFLEDLDATLEHQLNKTFQPTKKQPVVYEAGRLPISQKVAFFKDAQEEIIEVGTSVRSFVGYFEQRPEHEWEQPVKEILRKGVHFKIFVLDPDSQAAQIYSQDRVEPELIPRIRDSVRKLCSLSDKFAEEGLRGKFEIFLYSRIPTCYIFMVDPSEEMGRMHFSHYLGSMKRADAPTFEVHKVDNPILFEKYSRYLKDLEADSRSIS